MKRLFAVLLLLSILVPLAVPAAAAPADWVIDEYSSPFPMDTTIDGDLILTEDCPAVVNLINTRVNGTLRIDASHTVTVYFQGETAVARAEITGKARIIGGSFDAITSEAEFLSLQDTAVENLTLNGENSLLTATGTIQSLTVNGKNTILGGSGRAEALTINAAGCTQLLYSPDVTKTVEEEPETAPTSDAVKVDFQMNPTVSPADSVVRAKVTFTNVPEEKRGDYRIYWYIGQTLSDYDWHFTLEPGAVASLERSIHFDGVMESAPVWVRLVSNAEDDDTELKFGASIKCVDYSTAEYDAIEYSTRPYSIDLIRNQNTVIVYGLDKEGKYTKIVNVFPCSTGYFKETSLGDFEIGLQMRWGSLMGDLYGQFCSQFNNNQLFHSVPYRSKDLNDIEYEEYKHLGSAASSGCVRLATADARWIYYHCNSGTKVHVYDSDTLPVVKPIPVLIREDSLNRGWDPTDSDPDNPTHGKNPPKLIAISHQEPSHPVPRMALN